MLTFCWVYDGDRFKILAIIIVDGCRRLLQCIKSMNNISNRSSTSKSCRQHILSPTFIISNVRNRSKIKFLVQKSRSKIVYCNWSHILGEKSEFRPCFVFFSIFYAQFTYGTGWKFITPLYYDNFAFFQGGQDILIRVKFLIFLKKTGNFGSGNLNHKLSPRTCLFHNRDSHLFNDKNLWKTRELRLFFSIFNLFKPKNQPRLRLRGEHLE